jgi:hypothetical protein
MKLVSRYGGGTVKKESGAMFQMYPEALETDADRRRELALATMRAAHGTPFMGRRVSGVNRIRHVVVALSTAFAVLA